MPGHETGGPSSLRTISWLLVEKRGDYRGLFTASSIAMNRSLGPLYDIPVSRSGWYIHDFPKGDPRSGLLTHASLLAHHSHPGRTSPTPVSYTHLTLPTSDLV